MPLGLGRIVIRARQASGRLLRPCAPVISAVAWMWRRLLFRTTFIAITGSLGKTTAKEGLAEILSSRYRTARTWRNQNYGLLTSLTVLRVRPWHRYAVIELGVARALGSVSVV